MAGRTPTRISAALRVAAAAMYCCLALTTHPTHAAPVELVTDAADPHSAETRFEEGPAYPTAATLPPPPPPAENFWPAEAPECSALDLHAGCFLMLIGFDHVTGSGGGDGTTIAECCDACTGVDCTALFWGGFYDYGNCYITTEDPSLIAYYVKDDYKDTQFCFVKGQN